MIPKYGGEPLPRSPLCLPADHKSAQLYVSTIATALDANGWSRTQRVYLRALYRKWLLRAEGRDSYFERYGTFSRPEGAAPPTTVDLIVARWKRMAPPETSGEKARRLGKGRIRKQIEIERRLGHSEKPGAGQGRGEKRMTE